MSLDYRILMSLAIKEARLSMNNIHEAGIPKLYIGSILVDKSGNVLGKAHKVEKNGMRLHGEYQLIKDLDNGSKKLTLVTTLEPCNFRHKNNNTMPSCQELIIKKGIGRVVVGTLDPHPKISGKSLEVMRKSGIKVILLEGNKKYVNLLTILLIAYGVRFKPN